MGEGMHPLPIKQSDQAHIIDDFHKPSCRFGHIYVNTVGPSPPSKGSRYLFSTIDRLMRLFEVVPMVKASSSSCALALPLGWISCFGVPEHITSDHVTLQLWISLMQLLGTTFHQTTTLNPEANGMVECTRRTLEAAVMAGCTLQDRLCNCPGSFYVWTSPKGGINESIAELV